jgi:hypothetical protein
MKTSLLDNHNDYYADEVLDFLHQEVSQLSAETLFSQVSRNYVFVLCISWGREYTPKKLVVKR